jgi:hypothetical protein
MEFILSLGSTFDPVRSRNRNWGLVETASGTVRRAATTVEERAEELSKEVGILDLLYVLVCKIYLTALSLVGVLLLLLLFLAQVPTVGNLETKLPQAILNVFHHDVR